jgi:hypothetical protein
MRFGVTVLSAVPSTSGGLALERSTVQNNNFCRIFSRQSCAHALRGKRRIYMVRNRFLNAYRSRRRHTTLRLKPDQLSRTRRRRRAPSPTCRVFEKLRRCASAGGTSPGPLNSTAHAVVHPLTRSPFVRQSCPTQCPYADVTCAPPALPPNTRSQDADNELSGQPRRRGGWNKGVTATPATRKKISRSQKEKWKDPEYREAVTSALKVSGGKPSPQRDSSIKFSKS